MCTCTMDDCHMYAALLEFGRRSALSASEKLIHAPEPNQKPGPWKSEVVVSASQLGRCKRSPLLLDRAWSSGDGHYLFELSPEVEVEIQSGRKQSCHKPFPTLRQRLGIMAPLVTFLAHYP